MLRCDVSNMAAEGGLQLYVVSLLLFVCLGKAALVLRPLSAIYLPYSLGREGGGALYGLNTGAVEKLGYDEARDVFYAAGGAGILNVVDISDPSDPKVLHQQELPGGVLDIDLCVDYVAIAIERTHLQPSRTLVYPVYQGNGDDLVPVHSFEVSTRPDSLRFTHDCQKLVVLDEGWPEEGVSGVFQDPVGAAVIIDFGSPDLSSVQNPVVRTADFQRFDEMASSYHSRGVRWLLGGSTATVAPDDDHVTTFNFSQTMEPEYVTFNHDDSKAYVSLQDNNAIAVLDMDTATFEDIYPLGGKDWNLSSIDASDADGGIHLRKWPLYGLRMPDAIKYFTHNGRGYIATADEGVTTSITINGTVYSDAMRGQNVAASDLLSDSVHSDLTKDALIDPAQLGCLVVSIADGLDPNDPHKVRELHTFGGRGVSVFDAEDLSLVWDSGDDFERMGAQVHPAVFNSRFSGDNMTTKTPEDSFDRCSCNKGPEPQALTVGRVGDQTVIFVGNEKTSDIVIYSLRDGEAFVPKFESIYRGGRTDLTWAEAYEAREVGDTTPEDLIFIPSDRSPNGRPLLLVDGTVSGTVSVYEVVDDSETSAAYCLAVMSVLWSFTLLASTIVVYS